MKSFLAKVATFSLISWIGHHPALACGLMQTGVACGVGSGLRTPTYTPFTSPACYNSTASASITIPGVGIGRGVVWFGYGSVGGTIFSSATIGGLSPTGTIGTSNNGGMFYFDNTSGTLSGSTANVVVNFTGSSPTGVCVSSGLLTNLTSATPTIFTPVTGVGSVQPYTMPAETVASGGFGITAYTATGSVASTFAPLAWTVSTRDAVTEAGINGANSMVIGSSHLTANGTPTVACSGATCNFASYSGFAAAWR